MRFKLAPKKIILCGRPTSACFAFPLALLLFFLTPANLHSQTPQKSQLPHPRILDSGVFLQRDPSTGELRTTTSKDARTEKKMNPRQTQSVL